MSKIKRFFRRKSLLRNIILGILVVVTVGAAVGGVVALTRNTDKITNKIDDTLTYKSFGWTNYRVGGLDGSGKYMSTDQSLYTKDAFSCQGLNVTPVFDNEISYQIYFYDQDNEFVHTTGRLTGTFTQDGIPFFAKYARIVITPSDDTKVTVFELHKYASQLETKLYREQGFKNYTDNLAVIEFSDKKLNGVGELVDQVGSCVVKKINVSSYSEAMIFKFSGLNPGSHWISFYNSANEFLGQSPISSNAVSFVTSEGMTYCCLSFDDVVFENIGSATGDITFVRFATTELDPVQFFCR